MSNFIYAQSTGFNNAAIGKLETPLKMVIEHESDLCRKKGGTLDWLFNSEKSDRFGETIQYQDEFGTFRYSPEGAGAENDSITETNRKLISHIPFMKEFTITKEMLDDSNYGIGADAKRRAQAFVRAYYLTLNKAAANAIANGTSTNMIFNNAHVDLSTADEKPVFSKDHTYGAENGHGSGTQSNYFGRNRYASSSNKALTMSDVEDLVNEGASKIRNMKDENGEVLGYVADTIIIPGNLPVLEKYVKQVLGSSHEASTANNGINIQYGNWNLIIIPDWQYKIASTAAAQDYPIVLMSSEANKNLAGNMFFNRIPLSIKNWEDGHTRNWIWNGYCRFGIGFGTYKHMCLIKSYSASSADNNLTEI